MQELDRFSRRDRPFQICLAWQEHRKLSVTALKKQHKALGLHGEFAFLNPEGEPVDPYANRSEAPILEADVDLSRKSLTAMRKPIYLAGEFGGVTADIIHALGIDDRSRIVQRRDLAPLGKSLLEGLALLANFRKSGNLTSLKNGLSEEENMKLSASHRPSEIAALISLGLGRRFAPSRI